MSIVEAMKISAARVVVNHRWLEAYQTQSYFRVFERKPRQKITRIIYEGDCEDDAVNALMKS